MTKWTWKKVTDKDTLERAYEQSIDFEGDNRFLAKKKDRVTHAEDMLLQEAHNRLEENGEIYLPALLVDKVTPDYSALGPIRQSNIALYGEMVTSSVQDQFGGWHDEKTIKEENGGIKTKELGCYSSRMLDMGTCLCESHLIYTEDYNPKKSASPVYQEQKDMELQKENMQKEPTRKRDMNKAVDDLLSASDNPSIVMSCT